MMIFLRWLLPVLVAGFFVPAQAAYEIADIACETTSTSGTGTLDLGGAATGGYLGFVSQVTSGNSVPYHIRNGSQLETGTGVFTDGSPDTLTRVAEWSTDGAGAELTLSGTSTVCIGPIASIFMGGVASFSLDDLSLAAGGAIDYASGDVTLTHVDASDSLVINADVDNNAADSVISLGVDGNGEALLSGSAFYPGASDGNALGSTTNQWSDLFVAEGGVINWDNGDCILTQTGNALALTGCGLSIDATTETNIEAAVELDSLQGNLGVSHLNSGTSASSSTFWRGDGTWASAGATYTWVRQVFTSTGTYTPTSGMVFANVRCQAAGGGSGGADGAGDASAGVASAGGGGGEYGEKLFNATEIGANAAIALGSPGTAGTNAGGNGGNAGDSTFNPAGTGGTLTVLGGQGGTGTGSNNTTSAPVDGGPGGGPGSGADFLVEGERGGPGAILQNGATGDPIASPGIGGASFLGSSSVPDIDEPPTDVAGTAGNDYGGGAGGAQDNDTTGSAGAVGGAAICIVDELVES